MDRREFITGAAAVAAVSALPSVASEKTDCPTETWTSRPFVSYSPLVLEDTIDSILKFCGRRCADKLVRNIADLSGLPLLRYGTELEHDVAMNPMFSICPSAPTSITKEEFEARTRFHAYAKSGLCESIGSIPLNEQCVKWMFERAAVAMVNELKHNKATGYGSMIVLPHKEYRSFKVGYVIALGFTTK